MTTQKYTEQTRILEADLKATRDSFDRLNKSKQIELFHLSFDTTGARRKEELVKDLKTDFERGTDENDIFIIVNVGQLDQANKEGGYHEGDVALQTVASKTEQIIINNLRARYLEKSGGDEELADQEIQKIIAGQKAGYDQYRYKGSDFFVRIQIPEDLRGDAQKSEELKAKIATEIGQIEIRPKDNAASPKLTINVATMDGREIPQTKEAREKFETIFTSLEVQAQVELLKNSVTLLQSLTPEKARAHYDKYLKKVFGATPPELEQILSGTAEQISLAIVSDSVKQRIVTAATHKQEIEQRVLENVLSSKLQVTIDTIVKPIQIPRTSTEAISVDELRTRQAHLYKTDGQKVEENFRNHEQALGTLVNNLQNNETPYAITQEDVDLLVQMMELVKSQRGADSTQYLGPYIEEATKEFFANIGQPNAHAIFRERVTTIAEGLQKVIETQTKIEAYKHDQLTGLKNRGQFYKEAETLLAEGKQPAVMFVDMAFLKYFNTGGREVGDFAIRAVASTLEEATQELNQGNKLNVFRYGGDEFTILIDEGDPEKLNALIASIVENIEKVKKELGPIPATERSDPNYKPVELAFNYGIADRGLALDVATRTNETSDERVDIKDSNAMVEVQTICADTMLEHQKMRERLLLFFNLIDSPDVDREWVNFFYSFSAKSLGNMSIEEIRQLKSKTGGQPEAVSRYVATKVGDNVTRDQANERGLNKVIYQTKILELLKAELSKSTEGSPERSYWQAEIEKIQKQLNN